MRRLLFFFVLSVAAAAAPADENAPVEQRVIIVANARVTESMELARHYAAARHVPVENIIAVSSPPEETTTWPVFVENVFQPLQDELVKRGWIDAIATELRDSLGRRKYAMSGHKISYLVVCKGLPLRIQHDEEHFTPFPPLSNSAQFRTNASAVDSELSLLAFRNYPIAAYIPNPLFEFSPRNPFQERQVIEVSRLDGPSYEAASALVDHAIEAERHGLIGRAYIDEGGPYKAGDAWFEAAAAELDEANFEVTIDRKGNPFSITDRFDAPALYFGWYATDLNGPFAASDLAFPPGAVALHLHSFSATTLESPKKGWTGPLVARGVTATVGNVNEPYLEFTHQPQVIVRVLLEGGTWGDAAYRSLRALSWQAFAIGDPLYRPFAKRFSEQWENRESLPDDLYPYVVLRELHRLEREGSPDEAMKLATDVFDRRPSLAIAIKLAELAENAKDEKRARRAAQWIASRPDFAIRELRIADLAGQMLTRDGDAPAAVKLFLRLLQVPKSNDHFRRIFIDHGLKACAAAHDEKSAAPFHEAYQQLTKAK
ncbi:MAG TPA: TIGR03790 family protein [Opitutaceae bacterium]|nr:TIGR03790 family protein [Opitutaceae bacterium]